MNADDRLLRLAIGLNLLFEADSVDESNESITSSYIAFRKIASANALVTANADCNKNCDVSGRVHGFHVTVPSYSLDICRSHFRMLRNTFAVSGFDVIQ